MTITRLSTRDLACAAVFTALMALGAYVAIPIGSVPFTLQVFVVLLAGMILGPRLGALSVGAYLVLGLVAPVFHGGTSGMAVLIGPTGGYLWGFLPGVVVAGEVAEAAPDSLIRLVAAGLLGLIPIYVVGAGWLAVELSLTPGGAIASGVAPFILVDIGKAVLAALAARVLVTLPLDLPALQRGR